MSMYKMDKKIISDNPPVGGNTSNNYLSIPATCPNCKKPNDGNCDCMSGKPVGNITFSVCDNCWDEKPLKEDNFSVPRKLLEKLLDNTIECYNMESNLRYGKCITTKHKNILKKYEKEIKEIREILGK